MLILKSQGKYCANVKDRPINIDYTGIWNTSITNSLCQVYSKINIIIHCVRIKLVFIFYTRVCVDIFPWKNILNEELHATVT